jgi:hypothetical protein
MYLELRVDDERPTLGVSDHGAVLDGRAVGWEAVVHPVGCTAMPQGAQSAPRKRASQLSLRGLLTDHGAGGEDGQRVNALGHRDLPRHQVGLEHTHKTREAGNVTLGRNTHEQPSSLRHRTFQMSFQSLSLYSALKAPA